MSRLWEKDPNLNKVTLIIITIAVIAVFTIGATKVWGELPLYEDTVTFSIPENGTVSIRGCYFSTFSEENGIDYNCNWHIIIDDVEKFREDLKKDFEEKVAAIQELIDEIVDEPIPSNFVPEDKPKELIRYEEQLEYYQENPPKTYDQMDHMRKLETLKECIGQGLENTAGIQNERSFYISDYNGTASVPKTGVASALDIRIEECLAQREAERLAGRGRATLEGEFLSAQDLFGRIQPNHQDKAIIDQDDWPEIFTHENYLQPKQEDFTERQQYMCNSEKVLPSYKQDHGCSAEQIAIQCMALECLDTKWNDTGVGEGKKQYEMNWTNTSDGGGELPIEGWNMTPESEWTEEQQVKCGSVGSVPHSFPSEYERVICGKVGSSP